MDLRLRDFLLSTHVHVHGTILRPIQSTTIVHESHTSVSRSVSIVRMRLPPPHGPSQLSSPLVHRDVTTGNPRPSPGFTTVCFSPFGRGSQLCFSHPPGMGPHRALVHPRNFDHSLGNGPPNGVHFARRSRARARVLGLSRKQRAMRRAHRVTTRATAVLLRRGAAGNEAWNQIGQTFAKVQANGSCFVTQRAAAPHAVRGFAAQAAPAAAGAASGSITQVR